MAEQNRPLGRLAAKLLDLLNTYGLEPLEKAIDEALAKQAPHPQAVRHILENQRRTDGKPLAIPLRLPADPRLNNIVVRPHTLQSYDQLGGDYEDKNQEVCDAE